MKPGIRCGASEWNKVEWSLSPSVVEDELSEEEDDDPSVSSGEVS